MQLPVHVLNLSQCRTGLVGLYLKRPSNFYDEQIDFRDLEVILENTFRESRIRRKKSLVREARDDVMSNQVLNPYRFHYNSHGNTDYARAFQCFE